MLFVLLNDALNHKKEIQTLLMKQKSEMAERGSKSANLAAELLSNPVEGARKSSAALTGILGNTTLSLMEALDTRTGQSEEFKRQIRVLCEQEGESARRVSKLEQELEQEKTNLSQLAERWFVCRHRSRKKSGC